MKQILDQIRALHADSGPRPPAEPGTQLSPLKALTEQLKRGSKQTRTGAGPSPPGPPAADPTASLSPELATRVDLVLKELQSLNMKIDSNLQLLQPYVSFLRTAQQASGAGLNRQSAVSAVRRTLQRLSRTKQEVNELLSQQRVQIQQQQEYCRKYQERLLKTVQDFTCVSELLDSCTLMDLGSDLQTSRLLDHFRQARPHFTQLDAEVDYMEKSWETLRGVQETLGVKQLEVTAVKVEDLSELLELQKKVKNKIHQSESILDLTSSFHLTSQQGWTCFRVEQLEARLLSLDSLCVSWLNEASRREDKLRRELLTSRLNEDINQLRDSFKELKKRFSNLKFNYLKRNDRTRNTKAVRNQLQQVEMYKEKLQVLRKRLQGVTARLGSEVKDGGVTREVEDAVNELQRQMGDFERSVSEHQKTLEMTRRLQQAMEEYQFWCEEASATIARVGKFSSECRSTEAVSVLYRQFEKFVWPTVPQQEERISQIAELAVRLHGAEEGRRYIEKTLESLKKQNDGEKKVEGETERRSENETEDKDEDDEKKLKENRKMKKKEPMDNRSSQEAADMYELKETGHTPELTEHDGKEVPVKRQSAANRKPPLQKTDRQVDRQQLSSYSSTFSLSCSPVEANRRIHTINSQSQPAAATEPEATPHPSAIGPLFSDIQREFQRTETLQFHVYADDTPLYVLVKPGDTVKCENSTGESFMLPRSNNPTFLPRMHQLEACPEVELMTEDSLSNDEYECVSPDDISLPPLAETPESFMVQSDVEEGFCFSSHSVHISQYSHQYRAQSDHSGTGSAAVRQQRESSQTESCPTPPTSHHGSTRFRSGSSLFVQSPLTVPAPSHQVTSISILRASPANIRQSADPSPELNLPSAYKDNKVPEKRSPSQSESSLKEQRRISTQGRTTQNVASRGETLPQIDPIPQAPEFNHSPSILQPFNGRDPDLHKDKTPQQETTFPKSNADCFPQSLPDLESRLNHDLNSSQTSRETSLVSKPESNCTVTQQTIYLQSSSSNSQCTLPPASSSLSSTQESLLPQTETLPQLDPVSKVRKDKDRTQESGFLKSCATCPQTSTAIAKDSNLLRSCPGSRSGLDLDAASSQTSKDCMSQSSRPCTATKSISISVSSRNLRSQQGSASFPQGNGGPPEAHAPIPPEPNSSSSNRLSSKQSHQTVYLTSTCSTQQCVHGPGMTPSNPAKPTAPSQPESQTQALAQQANLHVIPLSSPSHLLTPDQDPNICQPMAIREEIRLTPQIQGPPFPAPPPQAESLPQGKASKPGPPCFTRPLSRATVMEGSPVTLEVAVTEHPEPRLTWVPTNMSTQAPTFTQPLQSVVALEGSAATFEAQVSGSPVPEVSWFRDGQVLSAAALPGVQISFSDGRAVLRIPAVTAAHSGRFSVRATNGAGQATSTAELLVTVETAPPNFLQRLQSSTVRQGSQVRLDVRVTGIPTPAVKFYREGAEIQSSADFRILQEGDLYSLLIAEAFPEDSGTYSVTATNSSGRATSTAELLVQGEEAVPVKKTKTIVSTSQMAGAQTRVQRKMESSFQTTTMMEMQVEGWNDGSADDGPQNSSAGSPKADLQVPTILCFQGDGRTPAVAFTCQTR
ncbi:Titin [Larimichthys crocea]|uniref:Uncharacterized protein n=1 Tax=Larimichthys crocea TaxID=215358 RepID=A0ACD3QGL4_LARCR|nr:Titin [Larimichthys crocea]